MHITGNIRQFPLIETDIDDILDLMDMQLEYYTTLKNDPALASICSVFQYLHDGFIKSIDLKNKTATIKLLGVSDIEGRNPSLVLTFSDVSLYRTYKVNNKGKLTRHALKAEFWAYEEIRRTDSGRYEVAICFWGRFKQYLLILECAAIQGEEI